MAVATTAVTIKKIAKVIYPLGAGGWRGDFSRVASSRNIRAKVSACGLGRTAGRPIRTGVSASAGAKGRLTSERGIMCATPSARIAAARCASRAANSGVTPSFSSAMNCGATPKGFSSARTKRT